MAIVYVTMAWRYRIGQELWEENPPRADGARVRTHACTLIHTRIHMSAHGHVNVRACECTGMCIRMCGPAYMSACAYALMSSYMCAHPSAPLSDPSLHTCLHTFTRAPAHAHAHTHMHTQASGEGTDSNSMSYAGYKFAGGTRCDETNAVPNACRVRLRTHTCTHMHARMQTHGHAHARMRIHTCARTRTHVARACAACTTRMRFSPMHPRNACTHGRTCV